MARGFSAVTALLLLPSFVFAQSTNSNTRSRASDLGLKIGILPAGHFDSITDVPGVEAGQTTIMARMEILRKHRSIK